jgi:2-keto-4-pentenoate hydratase
MACIARLTPQQTHWSFIMTPTSFDAALCARRLLAARDGAVVPSTEVLPHDATGAYAVQDAIMAVLGPVGGWKVGAKGAEAEPACAPLPASGLLPSGSRLVGAPWLLRGVELEVAFLLGRDLNPSDAHMQPRDLALAVDAVLPVIEVVETRLADWATAGALPKLADLQSHGALVMGPPSALTAASVDLRTTSARLYFDGAEVSSTTGGNPAADIWRMLAWLAFHAVQRGVPLKAGQVITTGSCTGMLFAPVGTRVEGELNGIGKVGLQF